MVDTSTIGVRTARALDRLLSDVGLAYVDAPVSGGVAGARARTLAVMYAGTDDACLRVEPVLAGLSDVRHRVGDRPGLAQAMKLANNFLSATALAATSEAIAFGLSEGLEMATMLEVLNGASGRSAATSDKFPNHVLTGRYASGFTNTLMAKDVRPVPARGRGQRHLRRDRRGHRRGLGALRGHRTGRRLHPHLSVRRGIVTTEGELR